MNSKLVAAGARRCVDGLVLIAAPVIGATGCHLMADPFTDAVDCRCPITTPSVEGAWAVETTANVRHRPFAAVELPAEDGTVTHGPLYFEDPDEEADGDDRYAWTKEDYLRLFNWRGRFLLNLALFPISVVVTPPWTVMASDGRPGREILGVCHDAEPWVKETDLSPCTEDDAPAADVGSNVALPIPPSQSSNR